MYLLSRANLLVPSSVNSAPRGHLPRKPCARAHCLKPMSLERTPPADHLPRGSMFYLEVYIYHKEEKRVYEKRDKRYTNRKERKVVDLLLGLELRAPRAGVAQTRYHRARISRHDASSYILAWAPQNSPFGLA